MLRFASLLNLNSLVLSLHTNLDVSLLPGIEPGLLTNWVSMVATSVLVLLFKLMPMMILMILLIMYMLLSQRLWCSINPLNVALLVNNKSVDAEPQPLQ